MSETSEVRIVIDTKLRQPACVLLQSAFGCREASRMVSHLFDGRTWLVAPTNDMAIVTGTQQQVEEFARDCNARFRAKMPA